MRINRTRERLKAGKTVLGCAIQGYRSSEIPRVLAAAGFDYFFLDMEHGGFDLETAQDMIATGVAAGITPVVRVAELHYSLVARLLDVGAQGIILPRVEDPLLLEEALSWMRYPPGGKRGFGVMPAIVDYEQHTMAAMMEHLNQNTLTVVQFETRLAMERADELLAVAGIDVAMVGPADLTVSLGIPGQFDDPVLLETVERFVAKCNAYGVAPGIHCRSAALAKPWLERGMRLIGGGSEQMFLIERSKAAVADLRAGIAALDE
jgi:2-dehydro-3-deoxyglucarate aldolase/4-hydroxy-2-oxoheptanedioate aldolase